jgi:hypothetical protein
VPFSTGYGAEKEAPDDGFITTKVKKRRLGKKCHARTSDTTSLFAFF